MLRQVNHVVQLPVHVWCIIRQYCLRVVHRCGLLLQMSHVCMSVCVGHMGELCKKNGALIEIPWPNEACISWGRDPPREEAILGVTWPIEKHWESLLQCMQQKNCSVLNNGITPRLLQPTAMLPLVRVKLHGPPWKKISRPPCGVAFCQNSLTTCFAHVECEGLLH